MNLLDGILVINTKVEDSIIYVNELVLQNITLDVIINFAGIHDIGSFLEKDLSLIKKIMDVNLMGAININHILYPLLKQKGKCLVVTFHSIEDRIVKNTFRKWTEPVGDPRLPVVNTPKYKILRTIQPLNQELENNPRARSAHMRGVEKISC